ncbi:mitochondrial glycoprotein [Phlyctochytrium arcticum]|nr:mitochondrial glycoprotein [Phlyctochytrium arcticum]
MVLKFLRVPESMMRGGFGKKVLQRRRQSNLRVQPSFNRTDGPLSQGLLALLRTHDNTLPQALPGGLWTLQERSGESEMMLCRTFRNEKISILFNIDCMSELQDFADMQAEFSCDEHSPVGLSIVIEKEGPDDMGALEFEAAAKFPDIFLQRITYFANSQMLERTTAESDWQRRGAHGGVAIGKLSPALQSSFASYLLERGFNDELTAYIHQIMEKKDQKEWDGWVEHIGKFIAKDD